jgi:hypothetical protein
MLEKHNPSWGNKVVGSGQVHCVRRLGLPDSEWEKVQPSGTERMFAGERHITCVKMSPEHADEVSRLSFSAMFADRSGNRIIPTTFDILVFDIRRSRNIVSSQISQSDYTAQ